MAGIIVKSVGSESVAPVGQGDRVVVPEFFDGEFADLSVLINLFSGPTAGALYAPWARSSLYEDSAGTTLASVDGPVGRMEDLSGNGNHATQATADARPVLRYSGGLYWLEGDGVDDFLASGTLAATLMDGSGLILAAWEAAADDTFGGLLVEQDTASDAARVVLYGDTRTSPRRLLTYAVDGTGRNVNLLNDLPGGNPHVSSAYNDGVTVEGWMDGALQGDVAGTASFSGNTRIEILRQLAGGFYLSGKFYGGAVRSGLTTTAERNSAERALANRSGVVLA